MRSFLNPFQRKRATEPDEAASTSRAKRPTKSSVKATNESGRSKANDNIAAPAQDTSMYSDQRFQTFFQTYADPDDPKVMGTDGIQKLFEEADLSLETAPPFLLAWVCKASDFGAFREDEWGKLKEYQIDTPQKLKAALTDLENALYSNAPISDEGDTSKGASKSKKAPGPSGSGAPAAYNKDPLRRALSSPSKAFRDFYVFCFNLMKKAEARVMEMELATATWSVVLQPKYPIIEQLLAFIADHPSYKAVNKDLWTMTLEFCLSLEDRSLAEWNEDESWPSMLDEFVAWERKRQGLSYVQLSLVRSSSVCFGPSALDRFSSSSLGMVKRRKSIKKPPAIVIEDGDEDVFEPIEALDAQARAHLPKYHKEADENEVTMKPDEDPSEANEEMQLEQDGVDEEAEQERAMEEWNAFREENIEILEQLPLSLFRSMALLRELDDQAKEDYYDAIEPSIRDYVALRYTLAGKPLPTSGAKEPTTVPVSKDEGTDGIQPIQTEGSSRKSLSPTSNLNAADRLGEGSSKSVSEALLIDEASNTPQLPQSDLPQNNLLKVATNALETTGTNGTTLPSPFAHMNRSHSSFVLARRKFLDDKPESTRAMLKRIVWLSNQSVKISEEKLGVATAAYNSVNKVDRHVRLLDATIKEHENSLVLGLRPGTRPAASVLPAGDAAILAAGDQAADEQFSSAAPSRVRKKTAKELEKERKREKAREKREQKKLEKLGMDAAALANTTVEGVVPVTDASGAVGMTVEVDPHEPVYCYCHQVSYGEFHLGCAGLTEAPKGKRKWYCENCAPLFKQPQKKQK
ncbi:hypothetical protein FRB90_002169 [Tulasnella sp. 427]|nr:hypothetical protein FRB90_002169 [Tulasnella sp. 427]